MTFMPLVATSSNCVRSVVVVSGWPPEIRTQRGIKILKAQIFKACEAPRSGRVEVTNASKVQHVDVAIFRRMESRMEHE